MKFLFEKPMKCEFHPIRESYTNWDPRGPDFEVKIRGHIVTFSTHIVNEILGIPEEDVVPLR